MVAEFVKRLVVRGDPLDSDETGVPQASSITQHQQLPGALAQEQDNASQSADERTEEEELRPWQVDALHQTRAAAAMVERDNALAALAECQAT